MKQKTERLSLGEIEALVRDALTRAGASEVAAAATAWAVTACERNGDQRCGLERLPAILEGLHTSAVAAKAQQTMIRSASRLDVEADTGLSDAAINVAFDTLIELVRSYGSALLVVSSTGDVPMPRPWLDRMLNHHVLGLSLGGQPQSAAASDLVPDVAVDLMAPAFVTRAAPFLTGNPLSSEAQEPVLNPVNGGLCIVGVAFTGTIPEPVGTGTALANRRHQADEVGVDVNSALLMHILGF